MGGGNLVTEGPPADSSAACVEASTASSISPRFNVVDVIGAT